MKRWLKIVLVILLLIVLIAVSAAVAVLLRGEKEETVPETSDTGKIEITTAGEPETETQTEETEPETEPYVSPIDFEALWEINPDVIGWIRIEDTNIDYPILFSEEDNEYYLYRDIYGNDSVYGSIYLDFESSPDFRGRHSILYGHRMKDGSMFKDVIKFRDESFFKEHPYYTIYTPDREIRLEVISCFYAANDPILRRTRFRKQEDFDEYVDWVLGSCSYSVAPEYPVASLYTLITCSYEVEDARTLLVAVEVDENGDPIRAPEETSGADQEES